MTVNKKKEFRENICFTKKNSPLAQDTIK